MIMFVSLSFTSLVWRSIRVQSCCCCSLCSGLLLVSIALMAFALFALLLPFIFFVSSSILSRRMFSRSTLRRFSSVMTVMRVFSIRRPVGSLYVDLQVPVVTAQLVIAVATAALTNFFIVSAFIFSKNYQNYAENSCTAKKVLHFAQ